MDVTFVAAKRCPFFKDIASSLEKAEGLKVTVSDYGQFGPQVFIEGGGVDKAYDVEQRHASEELLPAPDVEIPIFHCQPPSAREIIHWLSKEVKKNGYKIQESDIY